MKTSISHLLFNVRSDNVPFYKDLFTFLGWATLYEGDGMLGLGGANDASVWFATEIRNVANDYDGPGMNHLGIGAPAQADIDATVAYLRGKGVELLFDTPRHRPEFSSEGQTYYQVMFESPDRILFEVVYMGPTSS